MKSASQHETSQVLVESPLFAGLRLPLFPLSFPSFSHHVFVTQLLFVACSIELPFFLLFPAQATFFSTIPYLQLTIIHNDLQISPSSGPLGRRLLFSHAERNGLLLGSVSLPETHVFLFPHFFLESTDFEESMLQETIYFSIDFSQEIKEQFSHAFLFANVCHAFKSGHVVQQLMPLNHLISGCFCGIDDCRCFKKMWKMLFRIGNFDAALTNSAALNS